MPLVSFIIPLYNSAETIERTLSSVRSQSLSDIEIIMADDGSSDTTREIAGRIAGEDDRITFLSRTVNRGVSYTRNEALECAHGKYIRFVDADDTIPKKSTEKMVKVAEKFDSELVIGIMKRKSALGSYNFIDTEDLARKEVIAPDDPDLVRSFSLCNKLLRRSIIEEYKIRFDSYKHAEDGLFLFEYKSHISNINGCDTNVYTYYNPEFFECASSTSDLSMDQLKDIVDVGEKIREISRVRGDDFVRVTDIRMTDKSLLNEYYRKIWRFDSDTEKLLIESLEKYRDRIGKANWKTIVTSYNDLNLHEGILPTDEIVKAPLLTVVLDKDIEKEHLPLMLESLYYQKLPSFSVLADERLRDAVPEYYQKKKNFSFACADDFDDSESIFNYAIGHSVSRYLLFADHAVIFTSDSLLRSINLLRGDVDFISGNLGYIKDGSLSFPDVCQYSFASYSSGKSSGCSVNDLLDPYFANKVFSKASIARECFRFSADADKDIREIYSVFKHGKYRKIKYLLPEDGIDLIDMSPVPKSTYDRLALFSLVYCGEDRLRSEIKPLYENRKKNGLRKEVLFIPAGKTLGRNAKALYDALPVRKRVVSTADIKRIEDRMLVYSGSQVVVFESFDFRFRKSNIGPGQTVIPLADDLLKTDSDVQDAVRFIKAQMKETRIGFFGEHKALREWIEGASEDSIDSEKVFYELCRKYKKKTELDSRKVLFISDMREEMGGNFKALADAVPKDMTIETFFKSNKNEPYTYDELDHLAKLMCTSKYIVLEDYFIFTDGYTLRKGQELCQLWHACGAFKKFAASRAISGESMKLHQGYSKYTRVTVSAEDIRHNYAEAFGIDVDKVQACGVPRTDIFFDAEYVGKKQEELHNLYPVMNGKKVILFAPTYRGDNLNVAGYDFDMLDPDMLYNELHDEYVFAFKWHPAAYQNLKKRGTDVYHMSEHPDFFIDLSEYRDINDLLLTTDVLVTDYSSVIFDYIFMEKPIVFYTYDYKLYGKGGRDWYYDFSEYTYGRVTENITDLISAIKAEDMCEEKREKFRTKFMSACDGHSSEKTAAYFFG